MDSLSFFGLVKEFTELPGPIGREEIVQESIKGHWASCSESVASDHIGNIVARLGGKGPRILLVAHADEICFMVKSISPEGFIFLSSHARDERGYWPKGLYPIGQPALILGRDARKIEGIFTALTGHVLGPTQWERQQRLSWNEIFVETAANSAEELNELGIYPGSRVIWNPITRRLGKRIVGKAMDDRAALAILTTLGSTIANSELVFETYFGSTVQEEIGPTGAMSIGQSVEFDLAIVLDVGLCGDVPGVDKHDIPVSLGNGPILVYQDSETHYDYLLTETLATLAEEHGIPIQRAVFQSYSSDGKMFVRRGIPTALLAFPTRYTHSPFEMLYEDDLYKTMDLLKTFLTKPNVYTSNSSSTKV